MRIVFPLLVSVFAVNNHQWNRECTFQRSHGGDTFTFGFKPAFKMLTLEIVSADKRFHMITRKDFDHENEYLPTCESVETVVMNDDRTSATSIPWRYWDRAAALAELAGVVKPADHYCPPRFPFLLEQTNTRLKVDCLYRGIGDSILLYLSSGESAECAAAVDTVRVDTLCRSVSAWTREFISLTVDAEGELRKRNRQVGNRLKVQQEAPTVDIVNQLIQQRRAYFEPPPEMDYWDVSDDEFYDFE
jgi:hypothetical protein